MIKSECRPNPLQYTRSRPFLDRNKFHSFSASNTKGEIFMAFKLGYATLRWKQPDLEAALEELKKSGWDGWEGRLPLAWLGTPARVRRICENTDMPMAVYVAAGSPDQRDFENV